MNIDATRADHILFLPLLLLSTGALQTIYFITTLSQQSHLFLCTTHTLLTYLKFMCVVTGLLKDQSHIYHEAKNHHDMLKHTNTTTTYYDSFFCYRQ